MINAEGWMKSLTTYGPAAAALLVLIVGVKTSWGALQKAEGKTRVWMLVVYLTNWVVFFVLLGLTVYSWFFFFVRREYTIAGTIERLQGSESIYTKDVQTDYRLYLHKTYSKSGGHYDYDWRLVSPNKLPDGTKVRLVFDQSTLESERVTDYEIPVDASFYSQRVSITRKSDGKLMLQVGGKSQALTPVDEQAAHPRRLHWPSIIAEAYAQGSLSPAQTQARLEAGDPIIRRDARADLAKQGAAALPWIEHVLADSETSYRVRLGAISALNKMQGISADSLNSSALTSIVEASADPDEALRTEARRFLITQASARLAEVFDQQLAKARSRAPVDAASAGRISNLARSGLELYYNLGISEKDRYGSRKIDDRQWIGKAFDAFRKAWELQPLARAEDQILFAKALYGWGLALHDRSWIERRPDGSRDPEMVRQGQNKFKEFLAEVDKAAVGKYPYPDHVKKAKAYVEHPEPQSLITAQAVQ